MRDAFSGQGLDTRSARRTVVFLADSRSRTECIPSAPIREIAALGRAILKVGGHAAFVLSMSQTSSS
jgi:hypothetical protein